MRAYMPAFFYSEKLHITDEQLEQDEELSWQI